MRGHIYIYTSTTDCPVLRKCNKYCLYGNITILYIVPYCYVRAVILSIFLTLEVPKLESWTLSRVLTVYGNWKKWILPSFLTFPWPLSEALAVNSEGHLNVRGGTRVGNAPSVVNLLPQNLQWELRPFLKVTVLSLAVSSRCLQVWPSFFNLCFKTPSPGDSRSSFCPLSLGIPDESLSGNTFSLSLAELLLAFS